MVRSLVVSALVLCSWSCGVLETDDARVSPTSAESAPCDCIAGDGNDDTPVSEEPTLKGTAEEVGRWVKERTLRRLRIDPESYPQRPSSTKS